MNPLSYIAYLPIFNSIFLQTGKTPNKHGNPYTFTQNSDTITETADFCLIVRFFPYRHPISGIKKHKNRGPPTTVMNPTKP